jgi:hypothetical protein
MKHKHAELIKKWADGAEIQVKNKYNEWVDDESPNWGLNLQYRIKPEEKQDFAVSACVKFKLGVQGDYLELAKIGNHNVEFLFDGTTQKLKALRRLPE